MNMWLTKRYKEDSASLILTSRKPYVWHSVDGTPIYDVCHSIVYVDCDYFPQITFEMGPVEVELFQDDENPIVFLQRKMNSDGVIDLYYGDNILTFWYYVENKEKKWWQFWKHDYKLVKKQETSGICLGHRLKRNMYPEVTLESGVVGYGIRIKD